MNLRPAALLAMIALTTPAFAQTPGQVPPEGAMALPDLLRQVQDRESVASFDEVSWDDDGYWEIEFLTTTGARTELRVDPLTAATLLR